KDNERAHHCIPPFPFALKLTAPCLPKSFGVGKSVLEMNRSRWILVRSEPGENKWNLVAFTNCKFRNSSQVLALRFNWRSQDQPIGTGDCFQSLKPLTSSHPRHDLPVIKPNDKFHSHQHLTAHAFHNPDDVRILAARGHEIDETHSTAFGFDFRFENQ